MCHKHTDPPYPVGLLRVRGEWPNSGRAAEHGDEFASPVSSRPD
jgi:hypothetical protein